MMWIRVISDSIVHNDGTGVSVIGVIFSVDYFAEFKEELVAIESAETSIRSLTRRLHLKQDCLAGFEDRLKNTNEKLQQVRQM